MYDMLTTTRLECFLRDWGVKRSAFAKRAGISRQHLLRLRRGTMEPTRRMMVILAEAASAMRFRTVRVVELFELSHGDELAFDRTNDSRPLADR
jgi:transcriptional regulator with XRE-family HTH domain